MNAYFENSTVHFAELAIAKWLDHVYLSSIDLIVGSENIGIVTIQIVVINIVIVVMN